MYPILYISISVVIAYLLGSIPTAYLAGKLFMKIDIREHGSGNVGATNALRVLGNKMGIIVLLIDILKGALAVYIAKIFLESQWQIILASFFAIVGHIYTCFLGFKGGKGVATAAGVCFILIPVNLAFALFVFSIVLILSKYVSLSSISAALVLLTLQGMRLCLVTGHFYNHELANFIFVLIIVVFVIVKHIPNIKRLINGNENKISLKKKVT
ncbi:MAG: glycerol-3-phosphate 1-O-acyltransferase PlsY [Candidatus Cloacimonadales bacterium]|jgi:glycerol-3-phosphate acyltransferase PlsY|nr:glycerol-3-phosphate 1-O-acyltransferase PlsY [Candidatus Cloacimonadota bacterium]MDD2650567.1 glycerol-3-phosphate 1-O-acyltransferase PlsY [Candidatus Cloacimonadota bacterium]MDD3500952.1 glycerol-3-phosphate 1-O-acyltransferase PlsY [Candidatus Cloacimonadota bacterium]MDX9977495.1 glycerol-3-phosphate 1-O-acyltransferase PlsY [Candidatus Cloacimonadales bacterium]